MLVCLVNFSNIKPATPTEIQTKVLESFSLWPNTATFSKLLMCWENATLHTHHQCRINICSKCSNCCRPGTFCGLAVLCVKFVLYYAQGWILKLRYPRQTLRKGPRTLHMLHRNFIHWKQVHVFILSRNLLLRESPFHFVNCLKSFDFKLFFFCTLQLLRRYFWQICT